VIFVLHKILGCLLGKIDKNSLNIKSPNLSTIKMKKLLFICTGNICRSPTAHAIARHKIKVLGLQDKFIVDSAGTSAFHAGQSPDSRAIAVGKEKGIDFSGIKSRQITQSDFEKFDLILAMDRSHISSLRRICPPQFENKIQLFLQYFDTKNNFDDEVIDPYYGGVGGFYQIFNLIEDSVSNLRAVAN
jgi:protein-tyrosine phosphatase